MTQPLDSTVAKEAQDSAIQNIVIVGGGTAGWMTAAALSQVLGNKHAAITLVESEDIGTVGVGEATIPGILQFNALLGLDEDDFIKNTQATFKLGIEFVNWGNVGDSYIHPFGGYGGNATPDSIPFHHHWLRSYLNAGGADLDRYSLEILAAKEKKFTRPINLGSSPLSRVAYAYQFDSSLYAKYLRDYAEARGVTRHEGKIRHTTVDKNTGYIQNIVFDNGTQMSGDLFIDCSGFRALLIGDALGIGYENWDHFLPCDRAVTVACDKSEDIEPYTRATAQSAGWQWRIPLQHRTGNGHVYSSQFMSEDEATSILLNNLDGQALTDPRQLTFTAGCRKQFWAKNCVAIGLSSGFLEPLESTSIYLIQSSISKLIALFPDKHFSPANIACYNRQCHTDMQQIRDFIILHYHATQRNDSGFWDYCRNMPIPESLTRKVQLFEASGSLYRENDELFNITSWLAVMHGQGINVNSYNPIVDIHAADEHEAYLARERQIIRKCVNAMPSHVDFIGKHCRAI